MCFVNTEQKLNGEWGEIWKHQKSRRKGMSQSQFSPWWGNEKVIIFQDSNFVWEIPFWRSTILRSQVNQCYSLFCESNASEVNCTRALKNDFNSLWSGNERKKRDVNLWKAYQNVTISTFKRINEEHLEMSSRFCIALSFELLQWILIRCVEENWINSWSEYHINRHANKVWRNTAQLRIFFIWFFFLMIQWRDLSRRIENHIKSFVIVFMRFQYRKIL